MDNTTTLSSESSSNENSTPTVQEELRALMQLVSEFKKTNAYLSKKVIEQGDLLRQIREELPLVTSDAERGDRLYDTAALAERWQVSPRTIETEVAEGNLTPTFIRGARRFTTDAVRAYERTNSGARRRRGRRRKAA